MTRAVDFDMKIILNTIDLELEESGQYRSYELTMDDFKTCLYNKEFMLANFIRWPI